MTASLAEALRAALRRRAMLDNIARAGNSVPAELTADAERDIRRAEADLVRAKVETPA